MKPTTDTAATNSTATASDTTAAKPHYATRDFNDAGTGRQFVADGTAIKDVEPGALANYVAAGLASTDKPASDAA